MKLAVIVTRGRHEEEVKRREEYLRQFASPGTEIKLLEVDVSPMPGTARGMTMHAFAYVEKAVEAERHGFDAIIINSVTNCGLEGAKAAVDIPVIGAGEVMLHAAYLVADKFGVVVYEDFKIPELLRRWSLTGVTGRIASIRSVNIPVREFVQRRDELEAKLSELAEREVNEDGAQAVVITPTAAGYVLGQGWKDTLEKKLGVPIIDSGEVVIPVAEMMVKLGLRQSKKAFC